MGQTGDNRRSTDAAFAGAPWLNSTTLWRATSIWHIEIVERRLMHFIAHQFELHHVACLDEEIRHVQHDHDVNVAVRDAGWGGVTWIAESTGGWSLCVEMGSRWRARSNHWVKWWAALRVQGFAAIVARTSAVRARLVQSCRAAGVPGVATYLETLRLRSEIGWLESWRASSASPKTLAFLQSLITAPDERR
jgi:hypothetical protein